LPSPRTPILVALSSAIALAGACTLDGSGTRASARGGATWTATGPGGGAPTTTGAGGATTTAPSTTGTTSTSTTTTTTTTSTSSTTTTGAGGAGGGAAGGGGAGGTTTTQPLAEDCTNGVDDDGDGDADCADTECQAGFVCVPAPGGVAALVFLGQRAVGAAPNGCGALQAAPPLLTNLDVSIDGCACACGDVGGGVCSLSEWASFWPAAGCGGKGWEHNADQCLAIGNLGAVQSVDTGTTSVGQLGSCTAGVAGTPKPAAFAMALDRCLASTVDHGGCAGGDACVARPPAGLSPSACVEVVGDAGCPAGFPHARTLFEGVNDARTCSAGTCACGALQGATCSVTYDLFTDAACGTPPTLSVPMDGTCHATGFAAGVIKSAKYSTKQGGTCAPSGQPATVGEAKGTGPHVLCCQLP
jgi:hypothetical protein